MPSVNSEILARLWAIIPAGGAGTRLWPLSRAAHPKFLHDLTGSGRTLLQATADRLSPLVGQQLLVVTGAAHAAAVRRQLPELNAAQILAEPSPRDSMAAIAWAAAVVERNQPDALVASFAADHVITGEDNFAACVAEAAEVADTGLIVTIGIAPTGPATGFGYLEAGDPIGGFPTARLLRQFVEKPDLATATDYVASGDFQWNAGMFVSRASVLLDQLAEEHPELAAGARALAVSPDALHEIWPGLLKIAIDHAVAEPAAAQARVAMVPGTFGWDDIGDFDFLAGLLDEVDRARVVGDREQVLVADGSAVVVGAGPRMIAVVGLDDVVVVDTGDALLVTTRAAAQDVKGVVDQLRAQGRTDLL